jgi:hypothetical protein
MTTIVNRGAYELGPGDESLHTVGPELLWNESIYLDFATADGSLGGYVRLGLYPNWDRAWYWACLVGEGRPLVLLADNAAPLPNADLTIKRDDYVATHEVTRALEELRLTLDSSSSARMLDDPFTAYRPTDDAPPVPLAIDLTWSTAGGVYGYSITPRYEVPCRVRGSVAVGDEIIDVDAFGERDHSWGPRDWWGVSWLWSSARFDDGTFVHGMRANFGAELPWPSFVVPPGGDLQHADGFTVSTSFENGTPARSRMRFDGTGTTVTPLAFAPVGLESPDERFAQFPRALCRFEADDGRRGFGWTEWHQPPGWRDHTWEPAGAE